jgi:hypothetical protein
MLRDVDAQRTARWSGVADRGDSVLRVKLRRDRVIFSRPVFLTRSRWRTGRRRSAHRADSVFVPKYGAIALFLAARFF